MCLEQERVGSLLDFHAEKKKEKKKKKKKIPHRSSSVAKDKLARWPAKLAASAFNQQSQYASSHNSPFSSVTVAETMASTQFAYPRRDGQAELACVAWLNTKTVYLRKVTHISTNPA